MKVVFLEDVEGVAKGGDVKEVKNGFARNYLIPKSLAVPASHDALQRIEKLTQDAEKTRLKRLADMKALSRELEGVRIDVEMRSGTGGRLYGSVTNAIVASKLSELTGREIDRRTITVPDSVRELGMYSADIRLHTDFQSEIQILVHPLGSDPDEYFAELEAASKEASEDGEATEATESEDAASEASVEEDEAEPEAPEPEAPESEEPAAREEEEQTDGSDEVSEESSDAPENDGDETQS